jgi:glycosyltransferase involved in cell wall biosynthesis
LLERFVAEAIQSALDQTFHDLEVIVIDDGSLDRTESVVRQFSGRVRYHRQNNLGVAAARNTGLSLARGEWVAFLDADDIWYREKLEVQMGSAARHRETSFFYSDMDAMDENGAIVQHRFLTNRPSKGRRAQRRNLISIVFQGPFPYPSAVLVRKDLLLRVGGFNPRFHRNYHEDFELFARAAHQVRPHFIPCSLVKYRLHKKPADPTILDRNWLLLLESLWKLWREDTAKRRLLLFHFGKYYSGKGKRHLRSRQYLQAREFFRLASSLNPYD